MNRINRHPQTNPLIQRVRRHAGLATLFHPPSEFTPRAEFTAPLASMLTVEVPDIQNGIQPAAFEPPVLQPKPVLEDNPGIDAQVSRPASPALIAPARQVSPPMPQFQDQTFGTISPPIQSFLAAPSKFLETTPRSEPGSDRAVQQAPAATASATSGTGEPNRPGVENPDWPRLHDILRRHEIKQAQIEQSESLQPALAGAAQVHSPEPRQKTTAFEPNTPVAKPNTAVFESNTPPSEPNTAVFKQDVLAVKQDTAVSEPNTPVTKLNTAVSEPNPPVTQLHTGDSESKTAVAEQNIPVTKDKTAPQMQKGAAANPEQPAEQAQGSNFYGEVAAGQTQVKGVQRLTASPDETPGPTFSVPYSNQTDSQPLPESNRQVSSSLQPTRRPPAGESLDPHDAALLTPADHSQVPPSAIPISLTGTSSQNASPAHPSLPMEQTFGEDTPDQALSLDAIWPVERIGRKPDRLIDHSPVQPGPAAAQPSAIEPPLADAETIRRALQSVSPGQATDSSVELITPRQPRPGTVRQSDAPPSLQRTVENGSQSQPGDRREPTREGTHERSAHEDNQAFPEFNTSARPQARQEPPAHTLSRTQQQPPYLVPTEIGPLPSDLWPLIGEPVPPRHLTGSQISAADHQAQPEVSSAPSQTLIQRAVIIEEIEPETSDNGPSSQRTASSEPSERNEQSAQPAAAEINLDELARQVYLEIRSRLQIEWERLRHRL